MPARARRRVRGRGRIVRARESWLLDRFLRLRALLEGMRGFGWHVVLVVLREHLACSEHTVGSKLPLSNDALALLEEIRQLAGVYDLHRPCRVGHSKPDLDSVPLEAARHHHAADAERAAERRLVR